VEEAEALETAEAEAAAIAAAEAAEVEAAAIAAAEAEEMADEEVMAAEEEVVADEEDVAAEEEIEEAVADETETQEAALTPVVMPEGQVRVLFGSESADLPAEAEGPLRELAARMAGDEAMRLELLAYAAGDEDQSSRARRMSLSRALAVRAFLINEGVRSTRMDVRALGNNVEAEPADRVDILPKTQ
jgi:outer membrane protein OmpA-like peptidoglycan-associated protein